MNFLTVKQFSKIWEISERRIIKLCTENRIPGAVKNGKTWMIPEDAIKPADKRNNVSKYINTEKRVALYNFDKVIGQKVIPLLEQAGFLVDTEDFSHKYYDGLIFMEEENREEIINSFAKKMNCDSSIVYFSNKKNVDFKFIKEISKRLKYEIGLRINALHLLAPERNVILNYDEIAQDIIELITKFKNTTGTVIETDGACLEFNDNSRTKVLGNGEFYKAIDTCFKSLDRNSYVWCASTMLEDEWTEEPKEMKFRVSNLEVANRGTKFERIFIFSKSKIKEFKNNKTLKIFMQSNIKTLFVDYDEILEKEPKLLEVLGSGWDGIDDTTLICDLPTENEEARGYINMNKREVKKAYDCFLRLKSYAKDLKEILK